MKRRILLTVAVGLIVTILTSAAYAKGAYLGSLRVVNCQEWVTLRAKPSTTAKSLTKVPLGAYVEAYAYNSEFNECYYNGMHGYILSSYLSSAGYSNTSSYLGTMRVSFCNEFVTLRASPSTSAASLTKVPLGKTVEAYTYNSEFYRCRYNGLEGYILASYLVPVDQNDIYDYYDYYEPDFPLVFYRSGTGVRNGEWKKQGSDISMRVKVQNISSSRTVAAFELRMYAEDVWGNRIYGEGRYYYATTKRKISPSSSVWSDYIRMPNRNQVSRMYVLISKVIFTDGTIVENDSTSYNYWEISW